MPEFPTYDGPVPYLTTAQMIEVDRAMMEDYRIDLIQMMENAGRNLAHLARVRFLDGDPRGRAVIILAGSGGNGGGALVAARRLHNYGAQVRVITTRPAHAYTGIRARQLDILDRMGVPVGPVGSTSRLPVPDLILDGIIGYSLQGAPHGTAAGLIRWANAVPAPRLALDVPSGLDATAGPIHEPVIAAAATLTLALPKTGLRAPGAARFTGELYLADISVPPALYASPALGLEEGPIFARSEIVRLSAP
ncbi:MAG: NAD(P)H-hydrate epimerase [Anaerolineae bacterium]